MIYKKRKIFLLILLLALFFFKPPVIDALEIGDEHAQINCSGQSHLVVCVVTDPNGKRLGHDDWTGTDYNEIAGSFGLVGLGCMECSDEEKAGDIPHLELMLNLIDGVYTVEAKGIGLTNFYVGVFISNRKNKTRADFNLYGVTDKGLTSTFKFTYNSTDQSKWSGTRVVTPSSIKQDITLSRKLGMIDNDGIMTSLLKKVEAIEASIQKGKTKTAKNQLNAFINEVKAQSGKHIDKELVGAFIRKGTVLVPVSEIKGAVKMLIEDAQYIMDNLE